MNHRASTNRRGTSVSTAALSALGLVLIAAATIGLSASAESVSARVFVLLDGQAPTAIGDRTEVVRMPGRPY